MNKKLLIYLITFVSFFLNNSFVFAYPAFTANSNIVESGGYPAITSGGFNWPGVASTEWHLLSNTNELRIRQNGVIDHFSLNLDSISNITHFYIEIWRKNIDGTFNRIYQEDFIASLQIGIRDYSPSTQWSTQEGDYIGYGYTASVATANITTRTIGLASPATYFVYGGSPASSNYTWPNSTGSAFIIKTYMRAPQIVYIGDSLTSGYPANQTFIENSTTANIANSTAYQLSLINSNTYQNKGIISQETPDIAARFTTDVINLHPRVAVLEGGINDIRHSPGQTKATFLADWTAMLNACQSNEIIPIVMLMYPATAMTNLQAQTRDDWNASLRSLAAGYPDVIVVDSDNYVGKFRPSGDAGNLWDIQDIYNADDLHYNLAGYAKIAQAIADNLPKPTASFDNDFPIWNTGNIIVNYNLIQLGGNTNTNISQTASSGIEYSIDGSIWNDATKGTGGDELTGLTGEPSPGADHVFVWDSATDLPNTQDSAVYLRIKPNDGTASATDWVVSNSFGIDNVAPNITSITSSNVGGAYKAGDTIHLEINFSEAVNATSSVSLVLNTIPARGCAFTVSNLATSSCDYVVQAGDSAAVLDVASISGTITDAAGNPMTNFVPASNLSASKTISINTDASVIADLTNDSTPRKSKTWAWSGETGDVFRFAVDQNSAWTPTGAYGSTATATQAGGNGTYYLHVQSKDSANNVSEVTTVSAVLDNTAPVITMSGRNPVTVSQGSTYVDSGATAADNIDNSVTVNSSGTVDVSTIGSYTINYSASDVAGNAAASVTRTVNVIPVAAPGQAAPAEPGQGQMAARIQYLRSEIARIQGLLAGAKSSNVKPATKYSCSAITNNLTYGITSDQQVRCLQEFLKAQGNDIYPEAIISGNFFGATKAAVIRYQEKHANEILAPVGLKKGNGFVGLKTRQAINGMLY